MSPETQARDAVVLALDAGTSGGRAALFDLEGRLHAACSTVWSYQTPAEAAPWGRSFDPDHFWRLLSGLVRQVLATANIQAAQVQAVSVTSQRQGNVFLDEDGRLLYAGPNHDLRAVFQAALLDSHWEQELYAVTGHRPALLFAPARLRWLQEMQPERYRRIASLLMISDWLLYRLCGQRCTEPSAAAETQLFDIRARCWSQALIQELGLPVGIYPPVRAAGAVAGGLTREAAGDTGLLPNTLVVIGGADTQCGLLAMNAVSPGQIGILGGWSMPLQQVLASPMHGGGRLWVSCHVVPGRWVLESNAGPAGRTYDWLRQVMGAANQHGPGPEPRELVSLPLDEGRCPQGSASQRSFQALERLAAEAPAGAGGALAFLGAQAMHAGELGLTWGGLLFPLGADFIEVHPGHLARAALEHIAFAARANLEQLMAVSGQAVSMVAVGGGLTRSRLFLRLLASVLGLPVQVAAVPEVSCAGAAMCAAVGAGAYTNLTAAAAAMTRWREVVQPERAAMAEYLDHYERWQVAQRYLQELGEQIG